MQQYTSSQAPIPTVHELYASSQAHESRSNRAQPFTSSQAPSPTVHERSTSSQAHESSSTRVQHNTSSEAPSPTVHELYSTRLHKFSIRAQLSHKFNKHPSQQTRVYIHKSSISTRVYIHKSSTSTRVLHPQVFSQAVDLRFRNLGTLALLELTAPLLLRTSLLIQSCWGFGEFW